MTKTGTAALIWTAVLGTTAIFGTWFFACVFPFAAIATIAALTLDLRRGLALVGASWAANQVVGFALMDYPRTLETVALGVSLGLGAVAAWAAARAVLKGETRLFAPRAVAALAAGFVAYQAVIYLGALGFGGAGNFTAEIVAGVALNDAIWFAGLGTLWLALHRTVFEARSAQART